MIHLFIKPLDTQFYRSGLPFDAGVDVDTVSNFPPWPRTIYGSLRAEGFQHLKISYSSIDPTDDQDQDLGDSCSFGSLVQRGPILAQISPQSNILRLFLPFPRDLVKEKDGTKLHHLFPSPTDLSSLSDLSQPDVKMVISQEKVKNLEEVEDYLLNIVIGGATLKKYLCNEIDGEYLQNHTLRSNSVYISEPRIGIKRNFETRTAAEGMLYQVHHYRLNDIGGVCGFLVDLEYKSEEENRQIFSQHGVLRLGGESRPAAYNQIEEHLWWNTPKEHVVQMISSNGYFKAYLITPAIFKKGAIPDNCQKIGKNLIKGELKVDGQTKEFRLVGVCLGKKNRIGGWNIHGKRPKPMRSAVPAGSVYFFKFEDWPQEEEERKKWANALWKNWHYRSWCSMDPWEDDKDSKELGPGKEGFGLVLIGGWKDV